MKNIEINDDILNKAEQILLDKQLALKLEENKKIYIKICIDAKICPICGNELHSRPITKEEKKQYNYDYYYDTLFCEKDEFIKINGEYCDDDYY